MLIYLKFKLQINMISHKKVLFGVKVIVILYKLKFYNKNTT